MGLAVQKSRVKQLLLYHNNYYKIFLKWTKNVRTLTMAMMMIITMQMITLGMKNKNTTLTINLLLILKRCLSRASSKMWRHWCHKPSRQWPLVSDGACCCSGNSNGKSTALGITSNTWKSTRTTFTTPVPSWNRKRLRKNLCFLNAKSVWTSQCWSSIFVDMATVEGVGWST